jgi:hypothetical protein
VSSEAWTAIAALGASALTALASLGVVGFQHWLRERTAARTTLGALITELLSRSMRVAGRARAVGDTAKFRSGLGEGLDVALRLRKPADLLDLHDWLAQDMAPLDKALSETWVLGDQELIRLANDLVSKCRILLGVSGERQPANSPIDRLRRWGVGDRWTPEMLAANQDALRDVAHARRRLAEYGRKKLGNTPAELFTLAATDNPGELTQHTGTGDRRKPDGEAPISSHAS